MFHLPDGPAQKARDKMFAANPTMVPSSWDGKHIDNPPDESRRDLGVAYVVGHRAVDLVSSLIYFVPSPDRVLTQTLQRQTGN
jgi:salicylate hydroxylase